MESTYIILFNLLRRYIRLACSFLRLALDSFLSSFLFFFFFPFSAFSASRHRSLLVSIETFYEITFASSILYAIFALPSIGRHSRNGFIYLFARIMTEYWWTRKDNICSLVDLYIEHQIKQFFWKPRWESLLDATASLKMVLPGYLKQFA